MSDEAKSSIFNLISYLKRKFSVSPESVLNANLGLIVY
jgi:hypothetical protein